MSLSPMSHVEFKKCPCRRVEFRGQGPYIYIWCGRYWGYKGQAGGGRQVLGVLGVGGEVRGVDC